MSSKARRTADSASESATSGSASASASGGPEVSNAFLATLIEQAGADAGLSDDSVLSLADTELAGGKYDFAGDHEPGKYDFAGDDDRKQQDEALPALRESHAGSEYLDYEKGKSFVKAGADGNDIDPNDVAQGSLGDCYLIAGMAAVARANPEAIRDLIVDNGDGTFDVTLHIRETHYGKPKRVTKTVDARLASKSAGNPVYAKTGDKTDDETELWPALLEKTVAQHKGSYDLISGGNIGKGFQFHGATELFTGKQENYMATAGLDPDDALLHIAIALEEQKPVTCDSHAMTDDPEMTREATKVNVYGNHAYAPESVDLDGRTISLQNPWGSSHVVDLPVKDFLRYYRGIRIGA